MVVLSATNVAIYFGLAVWGYGGWAGFIASPARAGTILVFVAASVAAMFTSGNITSGRREDTSNRWILAPFMIVGFLLAWLPAYTDRREIWTIDGDVVRYTGLAMLAIGCWLRLRPVFVLGQRPVQWSGGDQRVSRTHFTDGLYRVVRHPSYLQGC